MTYQHIIDRESNTLGWIIYGSEGIRFAKHTFTEESVNKILKELKKVKK